MRCLPPYKTNGFHNLSSDKKTQSWDFPGGPVVKNQPSNAGDVGSIPGQGTKIPHAAGQLSLCATTTELAPQLEPTCRKLQSPRALEPVPQLEKRKPARHN